MNKSRMAWWLAGLLLTCATALQAADFPARLAWAERLDLGMLVSGVVRKVPARPGMAVRRGAPLVVLDDRDFRSKVARWQAATVRAEVRLAEAQREDERSQELYDRTLLSDHELQLAHIARTEAEAEAEIARAALADAQLALERSVLRAPMDGVVATLSVGVGQVVVNRLQSRPLLTLVSAGRMHAVVQVDAGTAAALQPGRAVTVEVDGAAVPGRVVQVGLEPAGQGGAGAAVYPVHVALEAKGLRAGQAAVVRID